MAVERNGSVERIDIELAKVRTLKRDWEGGGKTRRTAAKLGLFEVLEELCLTDFAPSISSYQDKSVVFMSGYREPVLKSSFILTSTIISFGFIRGEPNILRSRVLNEYFDTSSILFNKNFPQHEVRAEYLNLTQIQTPQGLRSIISDCLMFAGCNLLFDESRSVGSQLLRERARAETAEAEIERLQRIIDSSTRNARASADSLSALDPQGHFRVLGLHPFIFDGLTEEQGNALISAVYRLTAKRVHSDIGGTDEQMKKVNAARVFFADPKNRRQSK